jgi:UDP-N-acetyl-D-mannosaminouronate:lipid I N-acetyl-D-mannosaminouronosyltransferase
MEFKIINNIKVYAPGSRNELIDFVFTNKSILVAVNAEKIMKSTLELKDIINRNVGYPDGVGAVWALKKKGIGNVVKIPGCELWLEIIRRYSKEKTFYLVGGKDDVVNQTIKKIKSEFPTIQIVGFRNGYLNDDNEKRELILDIGEKKPDVVFVAMGSPKQELLMEEMYLQHAAVYQGLGGSFDVYNGNVERAPTWWINNNLEWAYRLIKQPTRIKRQLVLVKFFIYLTLNKF